MGVEIYGASVVLLLWLGGLIIGFAAGLAATRLYVADELSGGQVAVVFATVALIPIAGYLMPLLVWRWRRLAKEEF